MKRKTKIKEPTVKYVVVRKCVAKECVSIEATSKAHALEKVENGFGSILTPLEFEKYTDSMFWTVEKLSPPTRDECLTYYSEKK